ncbi:MAG: GntR family transcriptional regulator [Rhizobiaceae bacterium]|nr:GntR family transcriptional regulator [Rhizobiaceae bacterium]
MTSKLNLQIHRPSDTIPGQVVRLLSRAIVDGQFAPGRRLTEPELIELTGVSRTSIREAVRHLQQMGLVEPSPSRGVQVATMTRQNIEYIYEVREALEPMAAGLFVLRATDSEVEELASYVEPLGVPAEVRLRSIYRFDELLVRGARNPILQDILTPLHARIHALRRLSTSIPNREDASVREYLELVKAIQQRDREAAVRVSTRHVEAARAAAFHALDLLDRPEEQGK